MSDLLVHVRYFNVLADYAGMKQADVQVPNGTTIRGFLDHLIETNSERFQKALLHADGFNSYVRVFLNDHLVAGEGFETAIADGDEILLFPAIAGGGVVTTVVGLQRRKGSG